MVWVDVTGAGSSQPPPKNQELKDALTELADKLLNESKPVPPEISKIINDNLSDLLA